MATAFVRESVHSRLHPLKMAIEELGCRRDDGENNFTAQEPAVERLLNALDFVLNSDVQEPGEFFDVIKCASEQHSLNKTMRDPIVEVEGFHRQDKQDNFRLWLVSCLNRPGSLKLSLQIALPMQDVVQCFVQRNSIIFMESFADELLGTLSQLHNHPSADGLTTFKLDASCLQLFQDRSIEVHVESKRRPSRAVVPRRGTLIKATQPAVQAKVEVVKYERASQTEQAIVVPEQKVFSPVTTSARNAVMTDTSVNTEYPSSFLTFAELMELQSELEITKNNTKSAFDRAKVLESGMEEMKAEYDEKLEMLTMTLRKMKALYAELFQSSVESTGDLTEAMVDPHVRDIFAVLHGGSVMENPTSTSAPKASKEHAAKPVEQLVKREFYLIDENPMIPHDQAVTMPRCNIVLSEVVEKDRSVQVKLQDNKCAGCQSVFGDTGDSNLLFKVVQKAGETLRLQKPRRCHYCSELFCHRCHTNKTSILPFRVLQRWDFTAQHVCNRDFEFLSKNFDKSIYLLTSLPRELQEKPAILQCGYLRKKLAICGRLIAGCTHSSSKMFVQFLHGHYSGKELFYSLSDFSKIRTGDGRMSVVSNAVSSVTNIVPGLPHSADLMSELMGLMSKAMQHVKECASCIKRGSSRCLLCTDPDPLCVADDEATQCAQCRNIYHSACLSSMSCRICAQK